LTVLAKAVRESGQQQTLDHTVDIYPLRKSEDRPQALHGVEDNAYYRYYYYNRTCEINEISVQWQYMILIELGIPVVSFTSR